VYRPTRGGEFKECHHVVTKPDHPLGKPRGILACFGKGAAGGILEVKTGKIYWMEESIGTVIKAIADTPEAGRIQTAESLF